MADRFVRPRRKPVAVGTADRRESCGFADLDRFNLWRSMVVARIRGSQCVQAQPARVGAEYAAGRVDRNPCAVLQALDAAGLKAGNG